MEVFIVNIRIAKIILCFTILIFIIILFFYRRDVLRIFKKSESLNYYKDVEYVEIFDKGGYINGNRNIVIDDSEDIERLFEFLNSLELIKEELPRKYRYDDEYFDILIVLRNSVGNYDELFSFISNYVVVYNEERKSEYIEYYIKDSGYNSKDKKSKVYNFLYDMVNKKQDNIKDISE